MRLSVRRESPARPLPACQTGPVRFRIDAIMRLDESPLFRKVIVPWYDADGICLVTIVLLALVLVFAVVGLVEARRVPAFHPHLRVPLALTVGSAGVILSTGVRLVRRRRGRRR